MKGQQITFDEKFKQMTETPVERLVLTMAVPTIISMLITAFYNMADTFFVGRIEDTSATGAVGIVFSLMAIIQAIGFFFGHGSGNSISRLLGANRREEAAIMASTGFFTSLLGGLFLTGIGLLFLKPLALLLGSTDTILPYAVGYMKYILIGAPYMTASLVLNNQLRLQGNAFYAMIGLVSGAVLNIALDPIFIFTLDMGVEGAALATIISQLVGFFILLAGCKKGSNLPIQIRNFRPSMSRYKVIAGGGLPSLCRQGLASIAGVCLNFAAGPFGDQAIVAMTIVSRIINFAGSALLGFGQGFQPVCGFNYGAGLYERVKRAYWFCVKTAVFFLCILGIAGFFGAPYLIKVFKGNDQDVVRIGSQALRFQCMMLPLLGWIIPCNMMLQNIGKTWKASLVAMARQGLFFLPLILVLPHVLGIPGIQICQPLSDLFTFILAFPMGLGVLKSLK